MEVKQSVRVVLAVVLFYVRVCGIVSKNLGTLQFWEHCNLCIFENATITLQYVRFTGVAK